MKIIKKSILSKGADAKVIRLEVVAPGIAQKAKPGQFIVLMVSEEGERIPLTVVDKDDAQGVIVLIFQEAGFTTRLLGRLNEVDSLYALAGPLGHATDVRLYGRVILVGGGVGIAEIYPVAKALKGALNHVTTILGARTKDLLILEEELKKVSDELYIVTDDGSYGKKGFATDTLDELLNKQKYGLVYSVGPIPMMRKVASVTKSFNVKTIASLNALMVDATGMCGCCRVTVGGAMKFSCVDGPEFDAHGVDWDELSNRSRIYCDKEKHACKLDKQ